MPSKKRYWKIVANNAFKKEILDFYMAKEIVKSPDCVLKFAKSIIHSFSHVMSTSSIFYLFRLVENFQSDVLSYSGTNKALRMCRLFGMARNILIQKLENDSLVQCRQSIKIL